MTTKATVTIVQRVLPHYRVPFFLRLRDQLAAAGVSFQLVYGQERPGTIPITVPLETEWARAVKNRYLVVGSTELCWQPCTKAANQSDLVIVEQANRLLVNHVLQVRRTLGFSRLAFWGHGANFRASNTYAPGVRVKNLSARMVDWWFAYTERTSRILIANKFPCARITVVQNSIDTRALSGAMDRVSEADKAAVRRSLNIGEGPVGIYCGGMYPEKRLDFLLAACLELRRRVPGFAMIFVGAGPQEHLVRAACERHSWMHFAGSKVGTERAKYFAVGDLMLMPGAVGLVVVDAFAARLPMFTIESPRHGPEIEYLKTGVNGWITSPNLSSFTDAVIRYLGDPRMQERLKAGCEESRAAYTLENMTNRFVDGVQSALRAAHKP